MRIALLLSLLALAACGADGEPIAPLRHPTKDGITLYHKDGAKVTMSGEVRLGVTKEL
ncbi:argininosuccinate lyase [Acidimangrovimonas pyrenivorans]|uniref:Argininosuccinate lyase n=1 Tax=Acidimangrovimonas pyrenivorans TaxID=2030798 RepID=A0ABV7AHQ9_9RHOB